MHDLDNLVLAHVENIDTFYHHKILKVNVLRSPTLLIIV
jgi:hypothetical protein